MNHTRPRRKPPLQPSYMDLHGYTEKHQPIAVRTTMTAIIDWHIDHPFPLRPPEPLVTMIDYRHLLMVLVVLYSLNVGDFKQKQLLRCGEQPNHLPVNSYWPMFIFWWWFGLWYIPAPAIWWINTTQPTSSTPFSHSTAAAMGHDWRAAHSGHRHSAFRSCNMAQTLEMAGVFSICLFWLGLFLW